MWECTILDESGRACCNRRRINHDKNKTCQTSNLIAHLRERSVTCNFHKAAMKQVDIGSKNCVEVDGDMVKIHNFSEAFPHHVDLLWLRVRGLSISMISSDEFREFVRDYEPRASFVLRDVPQQDQVLRLASKGPEDQTRLHTLCYYYTQTKLPYTEIPSVLVNDSAHYYLLVHNKKLLRTSCSN
jgi:hypothetical protein